MKNSTIFSIFLLSLLSAQALPQRQFSNLEELLEAANRANRSSYEPRECNLDLTDYKITIKRTAEGLPFELVGILKVPSDFMERESFCGYIYKGERFLSNLEGTKQSDGKISLNLSPGVNDSNPYLIFENEVQGRYYFQSFSGTDLLGIFLIENE